MVVIMVVAILVAAAAFSAWWFVGRYWTTRDIAEAVVLDSGPGAPPGFKHSLAGKTVMVRGEVTNITTRSTTLGDMSLVELDDFWEINLVVWGHLDFDVGDKITMDVRFEWSVCNDEEHVYSPQVDFPLYATMPSIEIVLNAVIWVAGAYLQANSTTGGDVIISVEDVAMPLPFDEYNLTLRAGRYSFAVEYVDVLGVGGGKVTYGTEIDSMESLSEMVSANGTVICADRNANGLLDRGDRFLLKNLIAPSTDSGMKTYMLALGWEHESEERGTVPNVIASYIILTNRGVLRYTDPPGAAGRLVSEPVPSGQRFTFAFISEPVSWDDVTIILQDGTGDSSYLYPNASALSGGVNVTASVGTEALGATVLFCNVTDLQGNGVIDEGDMIVVTCSGSAPFAPSVVYNLSILHEPAGGQICSSHFGG